jgi:CRISPR-associated protein Cas1
MSANPLPILEPVSKDTRLLPDYLPARMVNEYVFCPRLFHLMWIDKLMAVNAEVIEGRTVHSRVDSGSGALPQPGQAEQPLHARSVTLSSESLRVIAKLDLVETDGLMATPVDYKRGEPKEDGDARVPWPADRIQIALQMAILRDNGYQCERGVLFYARTRQRIEVSWTQELFQDARRAVEGAWGLAREGRIPPPLVDAPQCAKCSLVGICLPDETHALMQAEPEAEQMMLFGEPPRIGPRREGEPPELRRMIAPRSDRVPVYLNTQGLQIGKCGGILQVREKYQVIRTVRIREMHQLNLFGNIQLTTQAIQSLCEAEIPIAYFSQGGWFYGITHGLGEKNIFLRQKQFRCADKPEFCLRFARTLVAGKIKNQRTLLMRNHRQPSQDSLTQMKYWTSRAEKAASMEELLGIEGMGARIYFGNFGGMLRTDDGEARGEEMPFHFEHRNRRPPRDPVNAMLSLAYSMLAKDWTITCALVGFEPLLGFYHQPRFGRPSLALDLMEPFRPLVADSAVMTAINSGMVQPKHFVKAADSYALTQDGRKAFYHAYELRMDQLITHPLFGYKLSYRRLLEVQCRLLARLLEGEIDSYPVFVTR